MVGVIRYPVCACHVPSRDGAARARIQNHGHGLYAKGGPAARIADRLSGLFEWAGDGKPAWRRRNGVPHMYYIQSTLNEIFHRERFDSIMAGLSSSLSECFASS